MDTKRTITVILIMMAVVILWTPLTNFVFQRMGYDTHVPPPQQQATTAPTTEPTTQSSLASTSTTQGTTATMTAAGLQAVPATQPQRTELGSVREKDPNYPIALKLNSVGAGIDGVVLNQFKKAVSGVEPYEYQHPYEGNEDVSRPLATRSIGIDDKSAGIAGANWTLQASSPTS